MHVLCTPHFVHGYHTYVFSSYDTLTSGSLPPLSLFLSPTPSPSPSPSCSCFCSTSQRMKSNTRVKREHSSIILQKKELDWTEWRDSCLPLLPPFIHPSIFHSPSIPAPLADEQLKHVVLYGQSESRSINHNRSLSRAFNGSRKDWTDADSIVCPPIMSSRPRFCFVGFIERLKAH